MAKLYDPKRVSVTIGGFPISGFAEDRMITVARSSDTFTKKVGCDGEVTRTKNADRSGEVTIHLMASSESNAILSGYAKSDELASAGTFSFMLKDDNGADFAAAAEAWVVKPPEKDLAKEIGVREWRIETDNLELFDGGTPQG